MKISLSSDQEESAERALNIIESNEFYIDTSDMGTGKTSIVVYLAQQTNSNLFIIRGTSISIWEEYEDKYDLSILGITTYQGLAGNSSNTEPKSGLLKYIDDGDGEYHHRPTKKLKEMIKEGVIFVFDEASSLKNLSTYNSAANTITREVMKSEEGVSRIALLSGTLMLHPRNYFPAFRALGFTKKKELFTEDNEPSGIIDIIEKAEDINKKRTRKIVERGLSPSDAEYILDKIYHKIIKKKYTVEMPPLEQVEGINAFYDIKRKKDKESIEENVKEMKNIVGYDDVTGNTKGMINFGKLSVCMRNINKAKARDVARKGIEMLEENKDSKLAIYCMNLDPLERIKKIYEEKGYKVLYVNGSINAEKRKEKASKFQEDNNKYRIILFTDVFAYGLSLDDQTGNHPRNAILFPSFFMERLIQSVKRFKRRNTVGNARVEIAYGITKEKHRKKKKPLEAKIVNSVIKKSEFARDMAKKSNRDKIILPGDYEMVFENSE
jgi:hypothetical protein